MAKLTHYNENSINKHNKIGNIINRIKGLIDNLTNRVDNIENSEIDTSNLVDKTNDQTIGGVKIFAKSPVVPTPTNNMHTATKKYVDDVFDSIDLGPLPDLSNYVDRTTAQIISGVKTFTSIPVTPSSNPTSDNQLTRKGYVDAQVATKISPSEVGTTTSKIYRSYIQLYYNTLFFF